MINFDDVYIRELNASDIEILRLVRNQSKNRTCFIYNKEISYEQQCTWYESYCNNDTDYMYSVIRKEDETPVGFGALYNLTGDTAEFGRLLVHKDVYKKSGLGTYILTSLIAIARDRFHLQKLTLEVFLDNISAIKIYLNCGFKEYDRRTVNHRELICMELYIME